MKKDYIKPRMIAIDIASSENILQSSYIDISGTTDKFNARGRCDFRGMYEEFEEETPDMENPDVLY